MIDVAVVQVLSQGRSGVIFSARTPSGEAVRVVVKGEPVFPVSGEVYEVNQDGQTLFRDGYGKWVTQFEVEHIDRVRTSGTLLRWWLQKQPNIGVARAARLIASYPGELLLEALRGERSIEELAEVIEPRRLALGVVLAAQLTAALVVNDAQESSALAEGRFLSRLENFGIDNRRDARRLWRLIGSPDDETRLLRNPYLAASIMPWESADRLGRRLLSLRGDADDLAHPDRLLGAVESAWIDLLRKGDTASAPKRFNRLLRAKQVDVREAIEAAIREGVILVDGELYRAPGAAWLEATLAKRMLAIAAQTVPNRLFRNIEDLVRRSEGKTRLTLTEEQRGAVQKLLQMPLGALQGGAGVGKTTVVKVLADAWEDTGGRVVLCALPGKAALQLSRAASSPIRTRMALTIARLVLMIHDNERRAQEGMLPNPANEWFDGRTLLVIDEASMVDTPSLRELLDLLPDQAHLLMVGDYGQLPPVGPGKVFHDIVTEGNFVVELTEIHRQAADSPIPHMASAIRAGVVPSIPAYVRPAPGIFFCETSDAESVSRAGMIYRELLFMHTVSDTMYVAALKTTVSLFNARCSSERPAFAEEVRLGPLATVAAGDPVVATRNRYADRLFNGLLGVVADVTDGRITVHWDGEDEPRELSAEAAGDLELAYALTCHRAQGSAAPFVVIPLERTRLMTREWLYTAVTRARETVVLIGSRESLARAVSQQANRTTGFKLGGKGLT